MLRLPVFMPRVWFGLLQSCALICCANELATWGQTTPVIQQTRPFGFVLDTQPVLPEISAEPRQYRIGLANGLGEESVAYLGERIYFLHWPIDNPLTPSEVKVGVSAGVHFGIFSNNLRFLLDTEDGYFGLMGEWAFQYWGAGLEFNHHSAHLGDGRFRTRPVSTFNQNFVTLRFVALPSEFFDFQIKLNIFLKDTPQNRSVETEVSGALRPFSFLSIEGFASFDNTPTEANAYRIKLSLLIPALPTPSDDTPKPSLTHRAFIPYALLHRGKHFFGQRYTEDVKFLVMAGLEFKL